MQEIQAQMNTVSRNGKLVRLAEIPTKCPPPQGTYLGSYR